MPNEDNDLNLAIFTSTGSILLIIIMCLACKYFFFCNKLLKDFAGIRLGL